MRTQGFRSLAIRWSAGFLILLLTNSRVAVGQVIDPIDPIIGPLVRIISPANHAVFHAPVDIPLLAYVTDALDTTNVEFFANGADIGSGFCLGSNKPPGIVTPQIEYVEPIPHLRAVYCLLWTNVQAGSYTLTAVDEGKILATTEAFSRTSPPVSITVLPPPPTNGPAIVSIVATDPIAIATTNSWVWPGVTNATPAWSNWPPPVSPIFFTNWGPKDGLFTVRRIGDISQNITVNYSIGGTASNGVDYVALPGYVNIPSGGAYGLIPIIPIDNAPPYAPKTVILTLTPPIVASPGLPPYIVGFPARAEVEIIFLWPRPLPLMLPDGNFHLNSPGPDGAWFAVEMSPDLLNWTAVCTNQAVDGSIDYLDTSTSSNAAQFYQIIPQEIPPSE